MSLTIRAAETPEDVAMVRALMSAYGAHLATGLANICIGNYEHELDGLPGPYAKPDGILLLAADEDTPAACVAFHPIQPAHPTTQNERACEMKRLWVDPAFRGRRLGRCLIEEGILWARTTGYTTMYLDTVPAAMPEANALYERLGFQQVSRYNKNPVAGIVFYRLDLA